MTEQPACPIACELEGIIARDDEKRADEITPHVHSCPICQAENERIALANQPWLWRLTKTVLGWAAGLAVIGLFLLLRDDEQRR